MRELARDFDVTAVFDPRLRAIAPDGPQVPEGVNAISAIDVESRAFDCNVYQMGNNAAFHSFMHGRALTVPGLLVMHDPSLYDFYQALCAGYRTPMFQEELRFHLRSESALVPTVVVDGERHVDRLAVLMSRRLVDSNIATVVHSDWAAKALVRISPCAEVTRIFQPARLLAREPSRFETVTFGVLGGINRHKRVLQALEAFAQLRSEFANARLVLAGRIDVPSLIGAIEESVKQYSLSHAVEIRYDVTDADLDRLILKCDVLVSLRWPTAGETSAIVTRAFGAGTPVITSDIPQFREFDEKFCWRVPIGSPEEVPSLLAIMKHVLQNPTIIKDAGNAARHFMESKATFSIASRQYREVIEQCVEQAAQFMKTRLRLNAPAANAIGCWSSTTGLGEAARRAVLALTRAGVSVALTDIEIAVPKNDRRVPRSFAGLPHGRPASIELCFLNINEIQGLSEKSLRPQANRYVIGYWAWELPELPINLLRQVTRVDEIWVNSRFTQGNLMPFTNAPVIVVPLVVEPDPDQSLTRRDFGIPDGSCIYLMNFDVSSVVARKNPFGVIDAFSAAFSKEEVSSAHLVIKTMNLSRWPEAEFELRRRLAKVGGTIIDEELTTRETASLTVNCDVYVSLHRAEGFGLGLAEAMCLGLPAVATRYSGCEDFLRGTNSCGVGYRMATVRSGELRFNPGAESVYAPGMRWAEPNITQAAKWMRLLYERPDIRRRLGESAAETIRHKYSSRVAGLAMRARLEEIAT